MITDCCKTAALFMLALLLPGFYQLGGVDSKTPDARKPYALLFGTVFDANDHPVYGIKVSIRRAGEKKAKWELYSDHSGEFAQRVPAGTADYVVSAEVKTLKGQAKPEIKVHVENDERKDFSLHLTK